MPLRRHPLMGALILVALLALVGAVSLSLGARSVPVGEVVDILRGMPASDGFAAAVVLERVPRVVLCLLAGAALGVSGLLMQVVTRNPVADPSILGVNSGASLAVVWGIAFLGITTAPQYMALAILGAAVTAFLVFGVGSVGGTTPLKLALAGTAVSVALSSFVSIIVMPRSNVMDTFRFWQMGSVSGASWESIAILWPVCLVGLLVSLACSSSLEVLALGDDAAVGLGARPGLVRLVASSVAVLLCGATTALAGPIGFVGLMAPHVVRLAWHGGMRWQLVLSALAGALVLTLSDAIGKTVLAPSELEVGIVTAAVGAPVFIVVAIVATSPRKQRGDVGPSRLACGQAAVRGEAESS